MHEQENLEAAPERETDQEIEDRRQSELQVERDERRERLGHVVPAGALPTPAASTAPPSQEPTESFDVEAANAIEADADFDTDTTDEVRNEER
jgi:hypothetical protein